MTHNASFMTKFMKLVVMGKTCSWQVEKLDKPRCCGFDMTSYESVVTQVKWLKTLKAWTWKIWRKKKTNFWWNKVQSWRWLKPFRNFEEVERKLKKVYQVIIVCWNSCVWKETPRETSSSSKQLIKGMFIEDVWNNECFQPWRWWCSQPFPFVLQFSVIWNHSFCDLSIISSINHSGCKN